MVNDLGSTTTLHFGAFGERQSTAWNGPLSQSGKQLHNMITTRGFTGHEQVDGLGIIHMNGRIYDPKLGRMLQADPFVQSPTNSQSLNRYSYVLNNPLSYTDPSGYFVSELFNFARAVVRIFASEGFDVTAWADLVTSAIALFNAFSGQAAVFIPGIAIGSVARSGMSLSMGRGNSQNSQEIEKSFTDSRIATLGGTVSEITDDKFGNGAVASSFLYLFKTPTDRIGEEGATYEYSEDVETSRAIRKRMQLAKGDGTQEMRISLTLSPVNGIDEATARSYIEEANAGWNFVIVGDDGITRSFGLTLAYASHGGNLQLVPCTPLVCTTGLGAANVGGPQMWYSADGPQGTAAHEMGHVFGFKKNRAYGTGSIMSGDLNRSVTQRDFDLLWSAYRHDR